jgi:hypothetical protein
MQALGPPEKEARTTGHGLIFSSYMSKYQKREIISQPYPMNESSKNVSMRSTKVLLVKKEYEECHLSLKEII